MTPETFVKTVLAREGSQKEKERKERLLNKNTLKALQTSLQIASKSAEIADMIKRTVFYGTILDQEKLNEKYSELVNIVLYQKEANLEDAGQRFQQKGINRLLHASLGMLTESAEFSDSLASYVFDGKEFDKVNAKEEVSDILWYCGLGVDEINTTFEEVFDINDAKLEKRFGKAFSEDKAINRNLQEERKVLENE